MAIEGHGVLGPGLVEFIRDEALDHELALRGVVAQRQIEADINYTGIVIKGRKLNLSVAKDVFVEFKAVSNLPDTATARTLSYLKATGLKRALLLNFGQIHLVNRTKRVFL